MPSQLILKSEFREMPWKNGGGTTFEIDREPSIEKYDWRLSQARIQQSGPFSKFPGYERLLAICRGEGVRFQAQELRTGQILKFDGATGGECELLGAEVLDLGLIYDPLKVKAQLRHFTQSTSLERTSSVDYFLNFSGTWESDALAIPEGACLKLWNLDPQSGSISYNLQGTGSLFAVSLQKT